MVAQQEPLPCSLQTLGNLIYPVWSLALATAGQATVLDDVWTVVSGSCSHKEMSLQLSSQEHLPELSPLSEPSPLSECIQLLLLQQISLLLLFPVLILQILPPLLLQLDVNALLLQQLLWAKFQSTGSEGGPGGRWDP